MKTSLRSSTKIPWKIPLFLAIVIIVLCSLVEVCRAQDKDVDEFGDPTTGSNTFGGDSGGSGGATGPPKIPKEVKSCDGIYISYDFLGREKEYPHVKNTTAQSWAFKSQLQLVNMGNTELKTWKVFIGFQHRELLVSVDGAVLVDGDEFPAQVGNNGTTIGGYPQADLKTAIDTAGDLTQIAVKVGLKGTQFGVKPPGTPMPKTVKLQNDGFKCPAPSKRKSNIYLCCRKDKKFKVNNKLKYSRKKTGDLNIMYDVLQTNGNNYLAQVTMENDHPLGRLDHWNLTWEWMRGEFISTMRGAFTHLKDPAQCIYGPAGQYYQDMDFTQVMNCERKPIMSDLPAEKKDDEKVGKLPFCCRNGTVLPKTMNESESKSVFQLQVFKIPPDMNRTALYPPQNWKLTGVLNPDYKCGPPMRVEPSEFPDPTGLQAMVLAVASWQVVCNITRPKAKQNRCCASFSTYYNDSVVPCRTCACGCNNLPEEDQCSTKAPAMLLPPEALLVPFENRSVKAVAWSKIKHYHINDPMPCPDNCGVSINWHVDADYKNGWTARMTLFNWGSNAFEDWFVGIQMGKASEGFDKAYSFNGTLLKDLNNTIFVQGLKGLNYLIAETNGTKPRDPRVPGKQQSVLSFNKRLTWHLNIPEGDGFPKKLLFNGEECALPSFIPAKSGGIRINSKNSIITFIFTCIITLFLVR
ncbi:COBRA-like protein 10 [Chenopodium quinoa]|uniref:COBRA-like protein 10 n=1 Tax=Chenopodium quinoa TaxID=63459 RepID=UPI000B76ED67|nr:COBRA-like protein 10 [Chenopodium quinoa]